LHPGAAVGARRGEGRDAAHYGEAHPAAAEGLAPGPATLDEVQALAPEGRFADIVRVTATCLITESASRAGDLEPADVRRFAPFRLPVEQFVSLELDFVLHALPV
jgi:hypothetical protein